MWMAMGAHRNMVKLAVIRELADGIVPDRLGSGASHPFNLMKSERLVWLFGDVDYIETKTMRERRGTSHGVSIRVARGLYYRPSTFRSRVHEWDEDVHVDTGLLGVTTKHIYFHGARKRFRVRPGQDRVFRAVQRRHRHHARCPDGPSRRCSRSGTAGSSITWSPTSPAFERPETRFRANSVGAQSSAPLRLDHDHRLSARSCPLWEGPRPPQALRSSELARRGWPGRAGPARPTA